MFMACTKLPLFLVDPNYIPDVEKVMKEGLPVHFSERYKDAIKTILPSLEQKGWLDFETG
jgi:hypothetical protein